MLNKCPPVHNVHMGFHILIVFTCDMVKFAHQLWVFHSFWLENAQRGIQGGNYTLWLQLCVSAPFSGITKRTHAVHNGFICEGMQDSYILCDLFNIVLLHWVLMSTFSLVNKQLTVPYMAAGKTLPPEIMAKCVIDTLVHHMHAMLCFS